MLARVVRFSTGIKISVTRQIEIRHNISLQSFQSCTSTSPAKYFNSFINSFMDRCSYYIVCHFQETQTPTSSGNHIQSEQNSGKKNHISSQVCKCIQTSCQLLWLSAFKHLGQWLQAIPDSRTIAHILRADSLDSRSRSRCPPNRVMCDCSDDLSL